MRPVLIFDYDGTIHDTMRIYEPAVREAFRWLREEKHVSIEHVSSSRIASWLGMNSRDMWNSFLPEIPDEWKERASGIVGDNMVKAVKSHQARWYFGIREVLDALKKQGYTMVILSNCRISYGKAHWEEFSLEQWFSALYDCETYDFAPKTEMIQHIGERFPGPYIVIGDRKSDLECARACEGKFIGCGYGFGTEEELEGGNYLAQKPEDIIQGILNF